MAEQIPNHYGQQFASNLQHLLQQKTSRLRGLVTTKFGYRGEQVSPVDQIGPVEMKEVEDRYAPKQRTEVPAKRRWLAPLDADLTITIDSFDKLRLLIDPNSEYVQAAHYAAERKFDDRIVNSVFADAMTGKTGTTLTAFPAGQQIAVNFGSAGNTNLTVAKMLEIKRLFRANEVDTRVDPVTIVISSKEEQSLLQESQVISLDYNDKAVLVDGQITRFLGMNIEFSERLLVDANGYRRIPAFVKSGIHLGVWQDIKTSIYKRMDLKGEPWECYVYLSANATRIEEKKVIEVKVTP